MRLKYSESAVPLRKKKGGHVFQSNYFGYSVITHQRNDRFRYDNQFNQKRYLIAATSRWRELSESEKQNWVDFAATIPQPCKFTGSGFLSGYACFVKRQSFEFMLNGPSAALIRFPSTIEISEQPFYTFFFRSSDLVFMEYGFYDTSNDIDYFVFSSNRNNESINFHRSATRFITSFDNSVLPTKAINCGFFYKNSVANDSRISSNPSFRVPSIDDIILLASNCGGASVAGGKLKEVNSSWWGYPNTSASDLFGFAGRGGGYLYYPVGFYGIFDFSYFWCTGVDQFNQAAIYYLRYDSARLFYGGESSAGISSGKYIRLVADGNPDDHGARGQYIGNDQQVYETVNIFGQIWLSESLIETLFNDLSPIPVIDSTVEWFSSSAAGRCSYNFQNYIAWQPLNPKIDVTSQFRKFFGIVPPSSSFISYVVRSMCKSSGKFFPDLIFKEHIS